jgi:hypothetical protein
MLLCPGGRAPEPDVGRPGNPGNMSAVVDTGNPVGHFRFNLVLIGWIAARQDRVKGLPCMGVGIRCGHSEEPVILWDGEGRGVQLLHAKEGGVLVTPRKHHVPPPFNLHRHPVVVIGEQEGRDHVSARTTIPDLDLTGPRRAGVGVGLSDPHSHEGSPFPTPEECQGCCSRQGQWIRCRGWPS